MGLPSFEVATGVIDGINTVFTVSAAYRPRSTAVFLNGQLKRADYADGWAETDPAAGVVTLFEAPLEGDVVHVFYASALSEPLGAQEEVTAIVGRIKAIDEIAVKMSETSELRGALDTTTEELRGRVLDSQAIVGVFGEVEPLRGLLKEHPE